MSNENKKIYAVQIFDEKKIGLHARPVAKITSITGNIKYKDTNIQVVKLNDNTDVNGNIVLTGKEPTANGKSLLSIIGLAVKNETKIAFIIDGPNSEEIIQEIKDVLKKEHLIS